MFFLLLSHKLVTIVFQTLQCNQCCNGKALRTNKRSQKSDSKGDKSDGKDKQVSSKSKIILPLKKMEGRARVQREEGEDG